jgi:hypothetical protein
VNTLVQFFTQHPYWAASITTWISNFGISAFVNALDAPTKDSGPFYRFFFKFVTGIMAQNPKRALGTVVETSPNFQDAVTKVINGNSKTISPIIPTAIPPR